MPVRIIGMIGVTPPARSATLLVIEGAISPPFIVDFAQAHEAADFDMVLVWYQPCHSARRPHYRLDPGEGRGAGDRANEDHPI